jgi:hypothetical protein
MSRSMKAKALFESTVLCLAFFNALAFAQDVPSDYQEVLKDP